MLGQGHKEACASLWSSGTQKSSMQGIKPYLAGVHCHIFFELAPQCHCPDNTPHLRPGCASFTTGYWHLRVIQSLWVLDWQMFYSTSVRKAHRFWQRHESVGGV